MKKLFYLVFVVVLLLCSFCIVSGKGTIAEQDAYDTYLGKTKSEVKQISKYFEKVDDIVGEYMLGDNFFAIDLIGKNAENFNLLLVVFDSKDIVTALGMMSTKSFMEGVDDSFEISEINTKSVNYVNASLIGVNLDKVIGEDGTTEDGTNVYYTLNDKEDICFTMDDGGDFYATFCSPLSSGSELLEELMKTVDTTEQTNAIKTKDGYITLVESKYSGSTLVLTFLIENDSKKNLSVSTFDFEAKNGDYEKLDQDWFNCPGSSLSGTITPGDKLRGNICFKNATKTPIKVYYQPNMFTDEIYIFNVK